MVYHQWPVGQAVKTSPSHGENRSSILLRVTIPRRLQVSLYKYCDVCYIILQSSVGVDYLEGPPVPIPNTVVKLNGAENTWGAAPWKNR